MDFLPIRRALLSVTHKDGLAEFATFLHANGVELVSTGGTLKFLENAGLPVTAVSDVTGFPEILGGRVKTLHPHIHGGILADKDNPEHLAVLKEKGIKAFDLICVNLYDFESALAKGLKPREAIEEIDIGGPCMLQELPQHPRTVRSRYLRGSHGGTQGQRYERFPAFPAAHGRPYVRQDLALRRDDRRISHEELEWIGEGRERFWRTAPLFPKPASVVCAPSPSRDF